MRRTHAVRPWLWMLAMMSLWQCGAEPTVELQFPKPPGNKPPQFTSPPLSTSPAPALNANIFPKVGATEFTTANERELLSNGSDGDRHRGYNANAELGDAAADGKGGAPSPGNPTPTSPQPEPTPDVNREIVEADVYKLDGDLLYVLNRYRGLVIIDVKNPDNMTIRGRLPFQAMPVEMYIRQGRAYVVSSDYFEYWQYDPDADPHGFHGSQVMIADVSNPDKPLQIGNLHVDGEVTDTRMVGDVLYAVSKRRPDYWRYNTADWQDTTWVVSLNVADPAKIKEIERIEFKGTSTLIHVAQHAIFVAGWDPNFYLTNPDLEQETLITYVDISDKAGKLRKRGQVYIPGQIADKFKMDWYDGNLRVFSQSWYQHDAPVALHTVSTAYPDQLKIDNTTTLTAVARSGLQATRFAQKRAFAFNVKWDYGYKYQRRYLHAVDLSQPLAPVVAQPVEVQHDSTHVEVHDNRILVLGQAYQPNQQYNNSKVALALYDVSTVLAPKQVAFTRLGEGNSSSGANYDYKALKTFPKIGLILVPLHYYVQYGYSFTGLQLVDWKNDQLIERGRVENVGGVQRAFPVKDRLVAVGEMSIASIDATNRDLPKVTKQLKIVHPVHDVFSFQGYEVQLVTDPYSYQVRLEVRAFGPQDDSPALATLNLPFRYAPYVLRDGDILHMFGVDTDQSNTT